MCSLLQRSTLCCCRGVQNTLCCFRGVQKHFMRSLLHREAKNTNIYTAERWSWTVEEHIEVKKEWCYNQLLVSAIRSREALFHVGLIWRLSAETVQQEKYNICSVRYYSVDSCAYWRQKGAKKFNPKQAQWTSWCPLQCPEAKSPMLSVSKHCKVQMDHFMQCNKSRVSKSNFMQCNTTSTVGY